MAFAIGMALLLSWWCRYRLRPAVTVAISPWHLPCAWHCQRLCHAGVVVAWLWLHCQRCCWLCWCCRHRLVVLIVVHTRVQVSLSLCWHGRFAVVVVATLPTLVVVTWSWPRRPRWSSSHGRGCIVNAAAGCHNVHVCGGRVIAVVAIVVNASGGGGHITWSSVYFVVMCMHSCVSVVLWVCSFNYN